MSLFMAVEETGSLMEVDIQSAADENGWRSFVVWQK